MTLFRRKPDLDDLTDQPASLQVVDASWYPDGRDGFALEPVSLSLAAGRILGVVGANGAGKSSFLRLVYRFNRPRTGQVLLDGKNIWAMPAKAVAQRVAAVLQFPGGDFSLTVRQIVGLGRTPYLSGFGDSLIGADEVIDDCLMRLDLLALADRDFADLSGGEKQRVMMARALAQQPGLIVMDEPTNHLDIRHQLEVARLVRELGITIVLSLHDLNMAADICDDVLLLDHGRALAFGPPDAVLDEAQVSKAFNIKATRGHISPGDKEHFIFTLNDQER